MSTPAIRPAARNIKEIIGYHDPDVDYLLWWLSTNGQAVKVWLQPNNATGTLELVGDRYYMFSIGKEWFGDDLMAPSLLTALEKAVRHVDAELTKADWEWADKHNCLDDGCCD